MTLVLCRRNFLRAWLGGVGTSAICWLPRNAGADFRTSWYQRQASAMGEDFPLPASRVSAEIYRFLWLRTFHNPISVRLEIESARAALTGKRLDGAGGYEPGSLAETKSRTLDDAELADLVRELSEIDFWNMLENQKREEIGFDGAQWILEGVNHAKYHIVERWSPNTALPYAAFCLRLVQLTGLRVDEIY